MISKKGGDNLRLFFLRLPRLRAVTPAYRRQALRRAGTSTTVDLQ